MKEVYSNNRFGQREKLVLHNDKLEYLKVDFFSTKKLTIALKNLKPKISFDKSYQIILFFLVIICQIFSVLSLLKFWNGTDWRKIFSAIVLSVSFISFLYMIFIEKKRGFMVFMMGREEVNIRMTHETYNKIQISCLQGVRTIFKKN